VAIRTVVTRGYGNGTFSGTIPLVVTRGYAIGAGATAIVTYKARTRPTYEATARPSYKARTRPTYEAEKR